MVVEFISGEEQVNSFTLANAVYDFCKRAYVDVSTVAQMMLLEATNKANSVLYNPHCDERRDTK